MIDGWQWEPPPIEPLPAQHQGRELIIDGDQQEAIIRSLFEDASVKAPNERNTRHKSEQIAAENARRAFILDAYYVACETALRISELASIAKRDVNFASGVGLPFGVIQLISAKTFKRQSIPMTPLIAEILKRRCETMPGRYLFRQPGQSLRMATVGIRRGFKRACERAGVPFGLKTDGIVFHTIRHSTATHLINSGLPLTTVQAITRHSSKTMLMRYSHPTPQTLAQAIEVLSRIGRKTESEQEPSL